MYASAHLCLSIRTAPCLLLASHLTSDIKAGWGMTFNPDDFAQMRAIKPCPADM